MMQKWFERKFDVQGDNLSFPGIMERLKGTPWRLHGILPAVPGEILDKRIEGSWSIKENIGHLLDLESLWLERARNYIDGVEILAEADLSNEKTHRAGHNNTPVMELIDAFTRQRMLLVNAFEFLRTNHPERTALHPRLKTPMRPVDLAYFIAEHDDHHLARITEICVLLEAW